MTDTGFLVAFFIVIFLVIIFALVAVIGAVYKCCCRYQ